jgi:hypothetical protein
MTACTSRAFAAALLALAVAGCGGHGHAHASAPPRPKLPRALAGQLAAASDEIARALTAGDGCGARRSAQHLQQQTIRAINGGRVPAAFQETLQSAVNDLAARIHCAPKPPPAAPAAPPTKGHGKHEGHGEGHGEHKGDQGDRGD